VVAGEDFVIGFGLGKG